jgi:hypothetical protein
MIHYRARKVEIVNSLITDKNVRVRFPVRGRGWGYFVNVVETKMFLGPT